MTELIQSTTITLLVAAMVGVGVAQTGLSQPSDNVKWEGTVHAELYNAQGDLVWEETEHNILTDEGANYFQALATGTQSNNINYIALSNASTYQEDKAHTYLRDEVTCCNLSRTEAEIENLGQGKWAVKASWVADGSVDGVKAAGLFPHDVQGSTDNDDNILVAESTMSDKAFRDGYRFELTWEIDIS